MDGLSLGDRESRLDEAFGGWNPGLVVSGRKGAPLGDGQGQLEVALAGESSVSLVDKE